MPISKERHHVDRAIADKRQKCYIYGILLSIFKMLIKREIELSTAMPALRGAAHLLMSAFIMICQPCGVA